jgi:hypothetical protein
MRPDQRIATEKSSEKWIIKVSERIRFPPFRRDILHSRFLAELKECVSYSAGLSRWNPIDAPGASSRKDTRPNLTGNGHKITYASLPLHSLHHKVQRKVSS